MTTKKITIAGREVTLAYCFATEIAFRNNAGVSIDKFDAQNPEHILYMIISSIIAWSQSRGEEPAIKDEELMYNAKPQELIDTLTEIFKLRAEWYEVPADEPEEENSDETTADSKNG